jgi:hypothetical protein
MDGKMTFSPPTTLSHHDTRDIPPLGIDDSQQVRAEQFLALVHSAIQEDHADRISDCMEHMVRLYRLEQASINYVHTLSKSLNFF